MRSSHIGNGIALTHPNNALNVRVESHGFDAHTFKVETRWGNGQTAQKSIDLAGILNEENHAANLTIPLEDLSGVSGATTPIEVTVRNQANRTVFNETFQISVLDYTKPEAEKVVSELPTDADTEGCTEADRHGDSAPEASARTGD